MRYLGIKISKDYQATSDVSAQGGYSIAGTTSVGLTTSLTEVLSYQNNAVVNRIIGELKVSRKKARSLFTDMKKFLWIAATSKKKLIPPPMIDEAWHNFILFTEDYMQFCEKYFGLFLHHYPRKPGEELVGPEHAKLTIDVVKKEFKVVKLNKNWNYVTKRAA